MKKLILGMIAGAFVLGSCKKAVTEHEDEYPHSEVNSKVVSVSNWTGDGDGYSAFADVDFITQDVHDNGAVMCYIQNDNTWVAMPITLSTGSWIEHYIFSTQVGRVNFTVYDDDGATLAPGEQQFKIVAINSVGMIKNPNVDLNDYEQVRQAFDLD
jgi:hypothetical protein